MPFTIVTFLGIGGPLLAMFGAALLAYDAFQGPQHAVFLRRYRGYIAHQVDYFKILSKTFPSPPYTQDEVKDHMGRLQREKDEAIGKLETDAYDEDMTHKHRVFRLAWIGFLLVAFGSLMQAAASLVAHLNAS